MDMILACANSIISMQEEMPTNNVEWDENGWTVTDFNDAFEANLNLNAPFES